MSSEYSLSLNPPQTFGVNLLSILSPHIPLVRLHPGMVAHRLAAVLDFRDAQLPRELRHRVKAFFKFTDEEDSYRATAYNAQNILARMSFVVRCGCIVADRYVRRIIAIPAPGGCAVLQSGSAAEIAVSVGTSA